MAEVPPEADGPPPLDPALEAQFGLREGDNWIDIARRASDRGAPEEAPPTAGVAAAAISAAPLREGPGTRIGPYKLLQLIGEGGFGSVFMAEQEKPVSRKVALKIIKLGMDTRQVIARFEAERQALAMMDHPNIARVLDAGATDTGRPFFVMELVKGDPIVAYCDRNNLSIEDRLELFAQVCQAVQHAHTKGIIHRDIKPSNILVSTQDGRPSTKVIDFGIAKATASKLTEKTLFTEHRALIGTPEYMSPEQAEGSLDIDTRTDVYSLGVLLYELLTGTTPFGSQELRSAAYAEIQRIIREVEPPKPSTRISQSIDTIASVAAHRQTEPKRLGTVVRGELDWIVMKALEKDRQRRYETANALGMDVRRYLSGEAVLAAPPSAAYQFRKFIRRNRVIVTTAGAVAAALLIGLIAFAWQAKVAGDQRDLAVEAQEAEAEQRKVADEQRRAAEAARAEALAQEAKAKEQEAEARQQAAIAEAVVNFQNDMLLAAHPGGLGDKVTVLDAIETAVEELDQGSLKDHPLVEAGVREAIGVTLLGLARFDEAESNLRKALAIRRAALPAGHPRIADSLILLGRLLREQNKLAEAEALAREALEINRAAFPDGHPDLVMALSGLGLVLRAQNKPAEAEPLLREALEIAREAYPAGSPEIGGRASDLATLLKHQNKLTEAEPLFRETLENYRAAYPEGHPNHAFGLSNLADLLHAQNKPAEAERLYREVLEICRAAFPPGHPTIARGLINLAGLLQAQNRLAEAEPLVHETLEIQRAALPAGHPDIARGVSDLAWLLMNQNRLAEAEPLFREALEIRRAALPSGHPDIAQGLNNLAMLLKARNKLAEAEPLFREALEIDRRAFSAGHPEIARGLVNLAELLRVQNRLAEAEPLYREALEIQRAALPAGHPSLAASLNNLALLLQAQGKPAEAEPLSREALAIRRAALPAGHPDIAQGLQNLASLLQDLNRPAEAQPLAREALEIKRTALPAGHPDIALGLNNLALLLLDLDRPAEAEPLLREALEIRRAVQPGHPEIATYLSNLARAQHGMGKAAEARAGWDEAIAMLRQRSPDGSSQLARLLWRSGTARLEGKEGGVAGDAAAALPELEEAVALGEKHLPPDHPYLKAYRQMLDKCKGALAEQAEPDPNGGKR